MKILRSESSVYADVTFVSACEDVETSLLFCFTSAVRTVLSSFGADDEVT